MENEQSTGKVVGLRGAPAPGEPVMNVVEILEDLLARAKAGDLRAIAFATVNRDNTIGTGWEKPGEDSSAAALSMECHGLGSGILTLSVRYGRACSDD